MVAVNPRPDLYLYVSSNHVNVSVVNIFKKSHTTYYVEIGKDEVG